MPAKATAWDRWVHRPQTLLLRKAFFQIHLWAGIACGIYVLIISVSGSAVVYRRELSKRYLRERVIAVGPGERLSADQLKKVVSDAYPAYYIKDFTQGRTPDRPAEVLLARDGETKQRLFNPYTGADLGNPLSPQFRFLLWLTELHDNLLLGRTGRQINGVGAIVTTILCITGLVIWWPGVRNWSHSLTLKWKGNPQGLNWSLHNVIGFWMLAFIFMWGISGIYLSFPGIFDVVMDRFFPPHSHSHAAVYADLFLFWLARLHFGRFSGLTVKFIWTVLGLMPALLFVTGAIMWWNRVLHKRIRALRSERASVREPAVSWASALKR